MDFKRRAWDNLVPLVIVAPLALLPPLHHAFNMRAAPPPTPEATDKIPLPRHADKKWPRRSLTLGETVLASRFFGPSLKLSHVNVYNGGEQHPDFYAAAQAFNGTDIAFYGRRNYSEDYAKETNAWKFGAFFHEIAHLVHHQQNAFTHVNFAGECRRLYEYELIPGKKWDEYCIEQQASIVEDYARRFLLKTPAPYRQGKIGMNNDALLMAVVEERFPGASELRAEMAAQRLYTPHDVLDTLVIEVEAPRKDDTRPADFLPGPRVPDESPSLAP